MSLNIKSERVHQLAREAAKVTGKSQTGAVEAALELLLASCGEDPADTERARRLAAIMGLRGRLGPDVKPHHIDRVEDLYDQQTGLPA